MKLVKLDFILLFNFTGKKGDDQQTWFLVRKFKGRA